MEILKCILVPFYACTKFKDSTGYNSSEPHPLAITWGIVLLTYIVIRFGIGYQNANNDNDCIIRSVGDVIITPMYALGCNMGKDRFEIKLN